jgi:hypothetical protein
MRKIFIVYTDVPGAGAVQVYVGQGKRKKQYFKMIYILQSTHFKKKFKAQIFVPFRQG